MFKKGIGNHLVAPNFEIPKNSTAISNIIPNQYKVGITLIFLLIGKIKTKRNIKIEIT